MRNTAETMNQYLLRSNHTMFPKKLAVRPRILLAGCAAVVLIVLLYSWTRPTVNDIQSTAFTQTSNAFNKTSIGFITAGLGKAYRKFAVELFQSAENHFCKNKRDKYSVDYILFSDDTSDTIPPSRIIYQKQRGWPADSENRFKFIVEAEKPFSLLKYDFLYWLDADMLFVNNTCEDILGQLVGAHHAWFPSPLKRPWPYEDRNNSMAFVPQDNQFEQVYFHATFYGGSSEEFMKMIKTMRYYSDTDHANGIQAKVDDESYLNKYYYDNPPDVVVSMGFVWTKYVPVKTRKIFLITRGKPPKD